MTNQPKKSIDVFGIDDIRPSVMKFALMMETRFRSNDYMSDWDKLCNDDLMAVLQMQMIDLANVVELDKQDDIRAESVDLANFALMLFDNNDLRKTNHFFD